MKKERRLFLTYLLIIIFAGKFSNSAKITSREDITYQFHCFEYIVRKLVTKTINERKQIMCQMLFSLSRSI